MPLPREHLLDELATAYVQVVSALAGATIAVGRDYGVDGTLSKVVRAKRTRSEGEKFIPTGFPVEFQLKGTTTVTAGQGRILYDLSARNYDLIVERTTAATPLYLFLVCFDTDAENWVVIEREKLILAASAYWWRQGGAATDNSSTVRVEISPENRLTPKAIDGMLDASMNRFGFPQ